MRNPNYQIETLSNQHDKKHFSCGIETLDRYLQQQASQDIRRYVAATFVLLELESKRIIGYYTLSSTSLELGGLPKELIKKLPKYPLLPATLLGRLAVDQNYQGKQLGELLLIDALKRSLKLSGEIASMAVVVEAINIKAVHFYESYGFIKLLKENKLFLPMATIAKI